MRCRSRAVPEGTREPGGARSQGRGVNRCPPMNPQECGRPVSQIENQNITRHKNLPVHPCGFATLEIEQYQTQKPRRAPVAFFVPITPLFGHLYAKPFRSPQLRVQRACNRVIQNDFYEPRPSTGGGGPLKKEGV